jgi:hypothetical protein
MLLRRTILVLLLVGSVTAWLVLRRIERSYRTDDNYSLIEERLYMGGDVAEPPPGTQAVLNLCEKEDPYRLDVHLWEPIPDSEPAPSLDWLRRMVELVDTQRRAGLTTYVHCRAGVSRSGMVVVAYVMSEKRWSRDQALAFVRTRRPIVRPHPAFMELLLEWEKALQLPADENRP